MFFFVVFITHLMREARKVMLRREIRLRLKRLSLSNLISSESSLLRESGSSSDRH